METPTTPPWPEVDDVPLDARFHIEPSSGWYASVKPSIEFVCALSLTVLALPLMGIGWLLVKLTSPGPGFYCQTRSGRGHKPYTIVKLRSMHHGNEKQYGTEWAKPGDPRIFKLGKFLRATHLDELPQLFNVLLGHMTLVGARPERPEVIEKQNLRALVPGYDLRLVIKPGVTGLAQVQLPADSDIRSVRHKVAYDLYYIVHRSLWLDTRLCCATFFKAAGMGPDWLRRIFFLPTRGQVAAQFLALIAEPGTAGDSLTNLVPA